MRKANVYYNGVLAGELTETPDRKYLFRYEDDYFKDSAKPAVSLTLPKMNKNITPIVYSLSFLICCRKEATELRKQDCSALMRKTILGFYWQPPRMIQQEL